jgi:4'-phosphopantetheinyl transferase
MEVYWLEQTEEDLPTADDWLSPTETARLNTMRFAKRRADWRLGRWTAKNALAEYLLYLKAPVDPQVLASIEIRPGPSGAPEAFFQNRPAAAAVSLSHRVGIAACAVAGSNGMLGCDLETIEPRSDAFLSDYFTAPEQSFVAEAPAVDRPRLLALLWSAKESTLKALHQGLRVDARNVMVSSRDGSFEFDGWCPIVVRHIDLRIFCGWWQHSGGIVRTLVAAPPPNPPIRFRVPNSTSAAAQGRVVSA